MDLLLYTILGTLIGTVIAMVLISEGGASIVRLSSRIVDHVLSEMPDELPEQLRQRWSEEIRADLATFSREPLGGLRFALKLRRQGGKRLAAELVLQTVLSAQAARVRGADPPSGVSENPTESDIQVHMKWILELYAQERVDQLLANRKKRTSNE